MPALIVTLSSTLFCYCDNTYLLQKPLDLISQACRVLKELMMKIVWIYAYLSAHVNPPWLSASERPAGDAHGPKLPADDNPKARQLLAYFGSRIMN